MTTTNLLHAAEAPPSPLNPGHSDTQHHGLAIVVAERGHVWVGEVRTDSRWVHIKGARVVRRWGTTEGLNQLATSGPLAATKLDAPADLKVAERALIAIIPCEPSKWAA